MNRFIAIGGGEMKSQTVINSYLRQLLEEKGYEGKTKPYVLFFPQASHESKPYTNTFFKVFGKLKCKADVVLFANGEMSSDRIMEKIAKADMIYVGGGDAAYLIDEFDRMGIKDVIIEAYRSGTIIAGNSAGAMLMFDKAVSDYLITRGYSDDYTVIDGYGLIDKVAICHADEIKRLDYVERNDIGNTVNINKDEAVYYVDGEETARIKEPEIND